MAIETADPNAPQAEPIGGAPDVDSVSKPNGSFGETMTGAHDIEVTVTYKGFQDPGVHAAPSSSPAPVFEVAVKNGSDMTIGQDLIKYQASYGSESVADADIICGDTESFNCDSNPTVAPGQSTVVTSGFTIPVGSEVHIEIQVYLDVAQNVAEFSVNGTAD